MEVVLLGLQGSLLCLLPKQPTLSTPVGFRSGQGACTLICFRCAVAVACWMAEVAGAIPLSGRGAPRTARVSPVPAAKAAYPQHTCGLQEWPRCTYTHLLPLCHHLPASYLPYRLRMRPTSLIPVNDANKSPTSVLELRLHLVCCCTLLTLDARIQLSIFYVGAETRVHRASLSGHRRLRL